ncbi:MAG: YidB family protein [Acidobacteriota bacterium]
MVLLAAPFREVVVSVVDNVLMRAGPVDAGLVDSAALMAGVLDLFAADASSRSFGAVLGRFERAGLAQIAASWVSTAGNLPITPTQMERGLGADLLGALAAATGVPRATVAGILCTVLPDVINRLTPEGEMPVTRARDRYRTGGKAAAIA